MGIWYNSSGVLYIQDGVLDSDACCCPEGCPDKCWVYFRTVEESDDNGVLITISDPPELLCEGGTYTISGEIENTSQITFYLCATEAYVIIPNSVVELVSCDGTASDDDGDGTLLCGFNTCGVPSQTPFLPGDIIGFTLVFTIVETHPDTQACDGTKAILGFGWSAQTNGGHVIIADGSTEHEYIPCACLVSSSSSSPGPPDNSSSQSEFM